MTETHWTEGSALWPWHKAEALTRCSLYWLPALNFPAPTRQRQWMMLFFDRLAALLTGRFGLRPEVFVQFNKLRAPLSETFAATATEFCPVCGIYRRPGEGIRAVPTEEESQEIASGRRPFDFPSLVPDYAWWFVDKQEKKQRDLFFGHGVMTILYLKPDEKTKPPEFSFPPGMRKHPLYQAFQANRMEELHARTFALQDGFQEKSKQLFGAGLEQDPQFRGLRFILPLLESRHFFEQPEEECRRWFELFDVYINESPADQGVLLATSLDMELDLIEMLAQMRRLGLKYPEDL
jgi:hypothetical protein